MTEATVLDSVKEPYLASGTVLFNNYEIEKHLAGGGVGEVYLAHTIVSHQKRAIKVIKPPYLSNATVLALFEREASALLEIRDDAVVACNDFFQDEQGHRYLVMEYVDGPSLAEILKQRALALEDVYVLRDRVVKGLAAAHAKHLIHRDLSPENVILPGGLVAAAKLIDFGIANSSDA